MSSQVLLPFLGEAQQVRGVKRGHHPDVVVALPVPTHPGQRLLGAQQGLGGDPSQSDDHLWPDGRDLLFQERQAGRNFIRPRGPGSPGAGS